MAGHSLSTMIDPPAPHAQTGEPPSSLRVLVVPSRLRHSTELRRVLASAPGLRCEAAPRLPLALKRLSQGGIDLVLAELDGSEPSWRAVRRLLDRVPQVPLVVGLDARYEPRGVEAVRLGAQDYVLEDQITPHHLARVARCAIERHHRLLALRDLSLTDPLTGIYNRRGFEALAEAQLRLTRRTRRRLLILCADLDHLKRINDAHGHSAGDRALEQAARLLSECLRDSDIVARVGGDEFAALAHETWSGAAAALEARIRAGLAALNRTAGLPYRLSISVGTVEYDGAGEPNLAALMARADHSLYRDKRRREARRPADAEPIRPA